MRLAKLEALVKEHADRRKSSELPPRFGIRAIGRLRVEVQSEWICRFFDHFNSIPEHRENAEKFAVMFWSGLQDSSDFRALLESKNRFVVAANDLVLGLINQRENDLGKNNDKAAAKKRIQGRE